jgi:hypothetical protein
MTGTRVDGGDPSFSVILACRGKSGVSADVAWAFSRNVNERIAPLLVVQRDSRARELINSSAQTRIGESAASRRAFAFRDGGKKKTGRSGCNDFL